MGHPARDNQHERRTFGERAADWMRLGMGTWTFLGMFLALLLMWIWTGGFGGWDVSPYFRLNLGLSCLAGLQGAILLISAKRADRIATAQASHDYAVNRSALRILRKIARHHDLDVEDDLQEIQHLIDEGRP